MIFEIYFKSVDDAEKAGMYQKFNNVIVEYRKGFNFFTINLPGTGETSVKVLGDFIKEIYPNGNCISNNFVSPRMADHIDQPLSYPIEFTVWNTSTKKFDRITL